MSEITDTQRIETIETATKFVAGQGDSLDALWTVAATFEGCAGRMHVRGQGDDLREAIDDLINAGDEQTVIEELPKE